MQIQKGNMLTGSALNRLIFYLKIVQSMNFRFTVSFLWDLLAILHERRSKVEKITIQRH